MWRLTWICTVCLYGFPDNERTKAAVRFWLLGLLQFGLGLCLLIIGGVAVSFHGDTTKTGAKYYTGAFIVGVFIILQSGFSMVIYGIKGKYDRLKKCLNFLLHLYAVSAVINCVLCLAGLIITGVAGICSSGDCSYEQNTSKNYTMSAIILTFIFLILATCVCSFVLLHVSRSGFGVSVFPFGQSRVADVGDNQNQATISNQAAGVERNQPRAGTSNQAPGIQTEGHDKQPIQQPQQLIPSAPPPPYTP